MPETLLPQTCAGPAPVSSEPLLRGQLSEAVLGRLNHCLQSPGAHPSRPPLLSLSPSTHGCPANGPTVTRALTAARRTGRQSLAIWSAPSPAGTSGPRGQAPLSGSLTPKPQAAHGWTVDGMSPAVSGSSPAKPGWTTIPASQAAARSTRGNRYWMPTVRFALCQNWSKKDATGTSLVILSPFSLEISRMSNQH